MGRIISIMGLLFCLLFSFANAEEKPTPSEDIIEQCKKEGGCVLITNKMKEAVIETLKQQAAEIKRLEGLVNKSCA